MPYSEIFQVSHHRPQETQERRSHREMLLHSEYKLIPESKVVKEETHRVITAPSVPSAVQIIGCPTVKVSRENR